MYSASEWIFLGSWRFINVIIIINCIDTFNIIKENLRLHFLSRQSKCFYTAKYPEFDQFVLNVLTMICFQYVS